MNINNETNSTVILSLCEEIGDSLLFTTELYRGDKCISETTRVVPMRDIERGFLLAAEDAKELVHRSQQYHRGGYSPRFRKYLK